MKKAFIKNSYTELLEDLENLYLESGGDEQILEIVGNLHSPRNNSIPASILFAKLLYKNKKFDQAQKILNEIQLDETILNFENKKIDEKCEDQEINEKWNNLFHALNFFIAIRQDNSEIAVKEAKSLLRETKYL